MPEVLDSLIVKGAMRAESSQTAVSLVTKASAAQTSDLQQWQDSAGAVKASMGLDGVLRALGVYDAGSRVYSPGNPPPTTNFVTLNTAQTITGLKTVQPAVATQVGLVVKGAASQSADLQQWQDSAGAIKAKMLLDGTLDVTALLVQGSPVASAPVKLNGTSTAIIPVDNADSWVIGSDRMDRDAADTTKDTRAFFNKAKGAFRAGQAFADQWDDISVGVNSHAEGQGTTASGTQSHAEGSSTLASGHSSHAEGSGTQATASSTHAEGSTTQATEVGAHAEGQETVASGNNSHAEGYYTTASSGASHAEGAYALANRWAQRARAGWQFAAKGDAQVGELVLLKRTTDATASVLTAWDGAVTLTGPSVNVLTLLASRAFQLKVSTVARRTDVQGEMAGFTWEGLVGRDSVGSARIIGAAVTNKWGDATVTDAWTIGVSINTTDATNNYVAVTATGAAGKTIRWVARMEWVEVAG